MNMKEIHVEAVKRGNFHEAASLLTPEVKSGCKKPRIKEGLARDVRGGVTFHLYLLDEAFMIP